MTKSNMPRTSAKPKIAKTANVNNQLSRKTRDESAVSAALKERLRDLRKDFRAAMVAADQAFESESKVRRWEERNPLTGRAHLQRKRWDRRHALLRRLKLGAKQQARMSSWEVYTHSLERFAAERAKTVFELLFKAEVANRFDHSAAGRPIARSVASELLSLSEEGVKRQSRLERRA